MGRGPEAGGFSLGVGGLQPTRGAQLQWRSEAHGVRRQGEERGLPYLHHGAGADGLLLGRAAKD